MPRLFDIPRKSLAFAIAPGLLLVVVLVLMGELSSAAAFAFAGALIFAMVKVSARPAPPRQVPVKNVDTSLAAAILDALPDSVLLIEKSRVVLAANKAATDLLGPQVKGRDLSLSLRHREAINMIAKVIGGEECPFVEVTLPVPVERKFEVHALDLPKGSFGTVRAVVVLHDVTGAMKAEEMRANFVANVSHELRSPLSSLLGFVETLQNAAKDDEDARERFLEIMSGEAQRMKRLIDDLLSLSQIEANEHVAPRDDIDLMKTLNDITATLSVLADKKEMSITIETQSQIPRVYGDEDQLSEVFQNLIDNAVKYGREKTNIQIAVSKTAHIPEAGGAGLAVSIINQGDGIDPEHIPRLTERFYRVDKGRSRSIGGTGLGLAIVKHIVNRHRGYLAIESEPGKGTTFTVYLPTEAAVDPGEKEGEGVS